MPSSVAIQRTPSLVGDGNRFLRDAAFRRPHALRANAKHFFVQVEAAHDLVARIFGMTKTVLRQRQTGRGDRADIRVAH